MEKCFTDQMSLFLVSGFANPLLVKVVRENKRVDLLMESAFRLCPIQPPQTQPEDIPFQPGRLQRLLDIAKKCQMDETVRFGVFQIERVDPLQIVPVLYRDTDLLGGDAVTVLQSGPSIWLIPNQDSAVFMASKVENPFFSSPRRIYGRSESPAVYSVTSTS